MCWKWGESRRGRHEVSSPRCRFRCLLRPGPAGWPPGGGCSLCPPHVGEDPGQVRHPEAWTAIGSRAPRRAHSAGVAADVPRGWRCPFMCLRLNNSPGVSKVYRNGLESTRDKQDNKPIPCGWILFMEDHLPLSWNNFAPLVLQFGLHNLASCELPGWKQGGTGGVWGIPSFHFRFSYLGTQAFLLRVISGGKCVEQTWAGRQVKGHTVRAW